MRNPKLMSVAAAVLALLALAAGAALTLGLSLGPATPAHAAIPCPDGPHAPPCADYFVWSSPFDDGCPHCPEYAIGFVETRYVSDGDRWRYLDDLRAGVLLLYRARVEQQPDLRAAAWKKFADAGAVLGGTAVKPGVVGTYDRQTGKVTPVTGSRWLGAAAADFADGLDEWCGTPVPGWPRPPGDPDPLGSFEAGLDEMLAGA